MCHTIISDTMSNRRFFEMFYFSYVVFIPITFLAAFSLLQYKDILLTFSPSAECHKNKNF